MLNIEGGIEDVTQKYRDFREALSDGQLSINEQEDLETRYVNDRETIQEESVSERNTLILEIESYRELKNLGKEDLKKIQQLVGIPKKDIDGRFGPQTFAFFINTFETIPAFSELGVQSLLEKYDEIYSHFSESFDSLSLEERKALQQKIGTHPDGIFGPSTFGSICEHLNTPEVYQVFFDQSDTSEEVSEEEGDISLNGGEIVEENTYADEYYMYHPEVSDETSVLNKEEFIQTMIQDSESFSKGLIETLQEELGFTGRRIDGVFGPISATRAYELYPQAKTLQEVFDYYEIYTQIDGIVSSDGNREAFRAEFGELVDTVSIQLGLPEHFLEAIIKQESTYGANLNSPTGAKGLTQLTRWPFKDMRGDTSEGNYRDTSKVERYRDIFRNIDFKELYSIRLSDETTIGEKIPKHVQEAFQTITSQDTSTQEAQKAIDVLFEHIKGDSSVYDHETNIIIGAVYLKFLHTYRSNGNMWRTAFHYNGDRHHQREYANLISEHRRDISREA